MIEELDILYFLHIPKTGGSSLQSVLEKHFLPEQICPGQVQPEFEKIADNDLLKYRLFAGHFWGVLEKLPVKPVVITWLRKPVPRAVSMYKHILRDPGHVLHEPARNDTDFSELMSTPAFQNSQVRHLARNNSEYHETLADDQCLPLALKVMTLMPPSP